MLLDTSKIKHLGWLRRSSAEAVRLAVKNLARPLEARPTSLLIPREASNGSLQRDESEILPRLEGIVFSIVLPAFNEERNLEACVEATRRQLDGFAPYEIIIAEDGCTDATSTIAARLAKKYRNARYIHFGERLGRGRALSNAFSQAKGMHVAYIDVDMATDMAHLKDLLSYAISCDVVTGSRYVGNQVSRSLTRNIASRAYNLFARLLFKSKIKDHQCGFKAFRKDAILKLCKESCSAHWFWDTEILVLAQRNGLRVKEFPVQWKERKETRVRLRQDVVEMGKSLLELWWRLRYKPHASGSRTEQ